MRLSLLVALGTLVPALATAQARKPRNTITLDEAREILGANPVALPDVPIEMIYRQSSYSIMLLQQPDSGDVVTLVERRGEYRIPAPNPSMSTADMKDDPLGVMREVQWEIETRQATRVFPGVTVWYVSGGLVPLRYDLFDRLEPIPPGTIPGATQSAPPRR